MVSLGFVSWHRIYCKIESKNTTSKEKNTLDTSANIFITRLEYTRTARHIRNVCKYKSNQGAWGQTTGSTKICKSSVYDMGNSILTKKQKDNLVTPTKAIVIKP